MRLLIIDNYDSFTFNLVQLVEQSFCTDYFIVKNDGLNRIKDDEFDAILISPGPGIADEAGDLIPFIKQYAYTKHILGICLGYEAITEIFGAKLSKLNSPLHGIQNEGIIIEKANIFKGLPEKFKIGHYHSWIVEEKNMPSDLTIIMKDENSLPMAVKHNSLAIYGLMFHPESIMTEYGKEMINNWLTE